MTELGEGHGETEPRSIEMLVLDEGRLRALAALTVVQTALADAISADDWISDPTRETHQGSGWSLTIHYPDARGAIIDIQESANADEWSLVMPILEGLSVAELLLNVSNTVAAVRDACADASRIVSDDVASHWMHAVAAHLAVHGQMEYVQMPCPWDLLQYEFQNDARGPSRDEWEMLDARIPMMVSLTIQDDGVVEISPAMQWADEGDPKDPILLMRTISALNGRLVG